MKRKNYSKTLLMILLAAIFVRCAEDDTVTTTPPDDPAPTLWEQIKQNAAPSVQLTSEFSTPTRLSSIGTLAWEDGFYVSDNGLHAFAFYAPTDLLKFVSYSDSYGPCPPLADYIRGDLLSGMDLDMEAPIDNLGGCTQGVMHSDIAYAHRSSTSENFSSWTRHSVSNPTTTNGALFYYEGGFSLSQRSTGNYDILFSRSTFDNNKNNLYYVLDVPEADLNSASLYDNILELSSLNTADQEDNPHLERVDTSDDNRLIVLYDNHGDSSATDYTMFYAKSSDGSSTWDVTRQALGANINYSSGQKDENIQGHLFKDGSDIWWLYFSSNRDGSVEIWRSQHNNSANIFSDFDNWASPEKVIAVGEITGGYGTIAGVGEPTLTSNGDLYFAVVYCKNSEDQTDYDSCDIDPWVAKKK